MDTKNVIINKSFEVPVVLTVQKTITVPDFTNMTKAINNNITHEKEMYEVYNKNITTASQSMTEQLGKYFHALFTPLIGDGTDEHNLLKWLATRNRFCCRQATNDCDCNGQKFYTVSLENDEYIRNSKGEIISGVEIKLGEGHGSQYPYTFCQFNLTYDGETILPKYTPSSAHDKEMANFASIWKVLKPRLEEKIRTELENHQKYYEKQTQSKYSDLVAIANFEI